MLLTYRMEVDKLKRIMSDRSKEQMKEEPL